MAVKRLGELTVDELKKELKKRGLDLNGDRNELMARLKKALSDEKKSQVSQLPADGSSNPKEKIPAAAINQPARRDVHAEATKSMEYVTELAASNRSEERSELEYSGAEFGAGTNSSMMSSEYESGSVTCKEEEAAKKVADDPPLDLMVDESQNDFDDDIVCVSVTPGKGYLVPSDGQLGRGSAKKIEGKTVAGAERTTPNQGPNTGSAEDRKISGQGDSKDMGIWISGLSPACRAADLKALFNKCGKVTGAKIVASAKAPASKCFGIVTMSLHSEVLRCLKELNGTTLHGNTLTLELYSGRRSASSAKTNTLAPTPTLWVTGIGLNTKAADLKKLFMPHGKVVAATIVMNPASGGARRGLIKMATCEEADACVQKLNKTMYAGHSIEVERAKGTGATQPAASKSTSKPAASQPPSLVTQKSSPSETSKPRSSFYGSSSASSSRRNRSRDRSNRFRAVRPRRAFSGPSRRMDREDTAMANRAAFEREREMLLMQQEREREMKAKQAELVRAFQMECDRRKQKEEADRIAYEREQLEIERMKLERERIEAERLKLQLEQERRQYEREQLERSRNEMFESEPRMPPKRPVEQNDVYWDYLAKKRRDSPAQPGMQGRDSGHDSYENASSRLQQMATFGEGRAGDNRIKESIPGGSGGGGGGGVGGSGGGAGNRPTGSMFHNQANSSADSGKSEWKSLYNVSGDGGGSNSQGQWKTPSSSLGGSMNGRQFGSVSSFRDRPYQEDQSPGFGSGGFKGFGAGRGGNKWR